MALKDTQEPQFVTFTWGELALTKRLLPSPVGKKGMVLMYIMQPMHVVQTIFRSVIDLENGAQQLRLIAHPFPHGRAPVLAGLQLRSKMPLQITVMENGILEGKYKVLTAEIDVL